MALLDKILGKPLASSEEGEQKVGVPSGIAILGLDGLSSAAYGPEAALTLLIPLGVLGLRYIGPIIGVIIGLLAILYFSYRQTIAAYPTGGGSYTVAKENLGEKAGLLAAAALLLDYVLNVAVGISAGVGALISAVPSLHKYTLALCLIILALITLVNLRGVRETGLIFSVPTYAFVGSLVIVLLLGVGKVLLSGGHPHALITPSNPDALKSAGVGVSLWLLLRAFASGCTAMTGVEAVSNGVGAFEEPAIQRAQQTLTAIVLILSVLLMGIAFLSHAYSIGATDPNSPAYQSVLSQLVEAVVGRGAFYYVTIASVLAVLALSANTSYAGFPRLGRLLAKDDYMPHAFGSKGRRLVYSIGIGLLTVLAGILLIIFKGITDRLIPLFAIGAFLAFTLSQAGMVQHWRRIGGKNSRSSLAINAVGAVATAIALGIILVAKFREGAWITLLLIPTVLGLFLFIKRHYTYVAVKIACDRPLDLRPRGELVAIVPIKGLSTTTEKALRFASRLSKDVTALHVASDEEHGNKLQTDWKQFVEQPTLQMHLLPPRLEVVASPYRKLLNPLLEAINRRKSEHPGSIIAVIVPELVETHWFYFLLHNQRATALKAALLLRGNHRVIVINVPWYLDQDTPEEERTLEPELEQAAV